MGRGTLILVALCVVGATCTDSRSDSLHPSGDWPDEVKESLFEPGGNWPQYLFDAAHTSHNSLATAITRSNARSLRKGWRWTPDVASEEGQPPPQLLASPTVYEGRVYIGARTGDFYALDAANGNTLWKRSLGYVDNRNCGARGITSTAAVTERGNGRRPVVYVGGGDGYLYALDGIDGKIIWKSPVFGRSATSKAGYVWSSPAIVGRRVYIGVSSQCGSPLIRGGAKAFDRASGHLVGNYWTVPKGSIGGSVWTSLAAGPKKDSLFATTGNGDPSGRSPTGDSYSLVRLTSSSLEREDAWTVPGLTGTDQDFPSSPILFLSRSSGHEMVGACNKNGIFYALDTAQLARGPVWTTKLSERWPSGHCLPAGVWDGNNQQLFLTGARTVIDGKEFRGSIRSVNPLTGKAKWVLGLPGAVWGTPSLNGAGVLAVPIFDEAAGTEGGVLLIDADSGELLNTIETDGSPVFSQPVFAGRYLFVGTFNQGLVAFLPRN